MSKGVLTFKRYKIVFNQRKYIRYAYEEDVRNTLLGEWFDGHTLVLSMKETSHGYVVTLLVDDGTELWSNTYGEMDTIELYNLKEKMFWQYVDAQPGDFVIKK